jgi:hypothetical protein
VFVISIVIIFICLMWFYLLTVDERLSAIGYMKRVPISNW